MSYKLDLESANKDPSNASKYFTTLDYSSKYGLKDLTAESVGAFVEKLSRSQSMFETYMTE